MRNDDQSFSTLENINKLFKRLLKSDKDALPLKHINKLVNDLTEMLSTDFHDTEIIVGEDEDIKTFKVHSTILKARSSYFKTTLSNSNKKSANGIFLFEMKNISPQSFEILLTYIYNGTISIDVDDMDAGSVLKLIEACAELGLDDLSEDLQNYLITEREEWIQQNLIYVDNISFEKYRPSLKLLQSYCDELCESYPELYLISNDFLDIEKSLFKSLVEKDALEMDEIEIWSYVIQWGIAQANDEELESKDVSLWDDDDFVKFKNILQDFIPLIRFNQITSSDFFYSVTPYKEIFDPILYEKIVQYYLDKRLSTSLCQKGPRGKGYLLNLQMKSLISSWIDDKMTKDLLYNSTSSPYDFELILRGSEDGFSRSVFEEKCYNIEQTLAIMRIHETNKLIGCYNPVCWNKKEKSLNDQYFINTDKSFIFEIDRQMFGSLSRFISKVDDKLINNSKLSKVINPQRAIFHDRQKISLKKENVKFHEIILNFLDLQLCISNNKRPYCLSNNDADNSYQRNLNIQNMIKNVHLLAEYEVYKLVERDFHKF